MAECKLCKEKDTEIRRILKGYTKDKKIYRIVIIVQFSLLLLITAFGADGIKMAMEFAKDLIK